MKRKNKAQSFLGYTLLIIVVAVALLAMRTYLVRSVQEKYRQSADVFGEGEQYAPGSTQVIEDRSSVDIPELPEQGPEFCSNIIGQIEQLNQQNRDSLQTASSLDGTVMELRRQARDLTAKQASELLQRAQELADQAIALRQSVITNNQTIAQLTADYPDCF